MTDLERQNLTSLIKTAAILSAQEREEWLMLLDLMNDKQVGELQRILKPVEPVVAAPKPAAPPFVPPPAANLPLKHIVNLPSSAVSKPTVPKPATPKPAIATKPTVPKTFSKFAEHLNQILAEKDLPVGEVEKPIIVEKPLPPKPVEQPKPVKPVEAPKTLEQVLSVSPPVAVNYDKPPTAEDLSKLTEAIVKPKPKPAHAGLQNEDMLFKAAVYQPPKAAAPAAAPAAAKTTVAPAGQALLVKLDEPQDAAGLQQSHWVSEGHEAMAEALKKIIAKSGYHEVIFNLQKSPLYNLYIDTGLKSLESPKRFEALGQNYLTKEQFEDFTDLLRELQV